jgi:hypothetical protein
LIAKRLSNNQCNITLTHYTIRIVIRYRFYRYLLSDRYTCLSIKNLTVRLGVRYRILTYRIFNREKVFGAWSERVQPPVRTLMVIFIHRLLDSLWRLHGHVIPFGSLFVLIHYELRMLCDCIVYNLIAIMLTHYTIRIVIRYRFYQYLLSDRYTFLSIKNLTVRLGVRYRIPTYRIFNREKVFGTWSERVQPPVRTNMAIFIHMLLYSLWRLHGRVIPFGSLFVLIHYELRMLCDCIVYNLISFTLTHYTIRIVIRYRFYRYILSDRYTDRISIRSGYNRNRAT